MLDRKKVDRGNSDRGGDAPETDPSSRPVRIAISSNRSLDYRTRVVACCRPSVNRSTLRDPRRRLGPAGKFSRSSSCSPCKPPTVARPSEPRCGTTLSADRRSRHSLERHCTSSLVHYCTPRRKSHQAHKEISSWSKMPSRYRKLVIQRYHQRVT